MTTRRARRTIITVVLLLAARAASAQSPIDVARGELAAGHPDSAQLALERFASAGQSSAAYHRWLAAAYMAQGEDAGFFRRAVLAWRSRSELTRALQLDPSDPAARGDLARYLAFAPTLLGGNADRATLLARSLVVENPFRAHDLLGWIAHRAGRDRDAEREFRAALAAAPDSAPAYLSLAHLLRDQERNDEAFALLTRGAALPSASPEMLYQLGAIGAETGTHLDDAAAALERYIAHPSVTADAAHVASAHWRLGVVHEKQGQLDRARAEYEAALRARPGNPDYRAALQRVR